MDIQFDALLKARNLLGLTDADVHVAEMVCRLLDLQDDEVFLIISFVGRALHEGHTCLTYEYFHTTLQHNADVVEGVAGDMIARSVAIDKERWMQLLNVFAQKDTVLSLLLNTQGQLFYQRLHGYEQSLAHMVRERVATATTYTEAQRHSIVTHITKNNLDDDQVKAVVTSVTNSLTIISGGPGTGKTTLVATLLQVLIEQAVGTNAPLKIVLAAPTGKASKHLGGVITQCRKITDSEVHHLLPEEALTIHRLLKSTGDGLRFGHNHNNLLSVDVVIVDEASMIDIRLMEALFAAIPLTARLILLGDYNQLVSVNAGTVLADLCQAGHGGILDDAVVVLRHNYRFAAEQGIGVLGRAVNKGDYDQVHRLLTDSSLSDIEICALDDISSNTLQAVLKPLVYAWRVFMSASTPEQALVQMRSFRVLCAMHEGWYGVRALNRLIEHMLHHESTDGDTSFYHGRPLIILKNDYDHAIYNGDIGIVWDTNGTVLVHFEDGRTISPQVLPNHASAYALTVHKAQGSEFKKVMLVLPDIPRPVVTRQLVYTALTRARESFLLFGSDKVMQAAVETPAQRNSGLQELLQ